MKKFLLGALLFVGALSANAELQWVLVTDAGTQIPMSQIECLMAADDAQTFSVLKNDATVVSDVTSVSFLQTTNTGVETISTESVAVFPDMVTNSILILGAQGKKVNVYSTDGGLRLSTPLSEESTRLDVSSLSAGTYILSVGKTSIKFIKK